MNSITIDGLDINVSQRITGFVLTNATSTTRTAEGIVWGGQVQLMSGDAPLGNRKIRRAIQENASMTFEELDAKATELFKKTFVELTVLESRTVEGTVLAGKMIAGINASDTGIKIAAISELVTAVVSAIA